MKLFRTPDGIVVEFGGRFFPLPETNLDDVFASSEPETMLRERAARQQPLNAFNPLTSPLLPPIENQEVWAAGVTYYRSRTARMEESEAARSADFYDRVYTAERPELFFKATPHRVSGHRQEVRIRRDSRWNVPEPELALCISPAGRIFGYTIGNDMCSREIEGENPLYLPQAKVYSQSCGLGPGILLESGPLPGSTTIQLEILRNGTSLAVRDSTTLDQMKRSPEDLVGYLFRDNSFPRGCFLLTGTGVIPTSAFSLEPGDLIRITIEPIGTLENRVAPQS